VLTKNTTELKLRARAHARYDHVKQGTYGEGKTNGKSEFEGCAVGCLSTPHRKEELRAYLQRWLPDWALEENEWGELTISAADQHQMLADEFGLCGRLVAIAEGLFEAQETHGDAINFVRDFACAIPEGLDITDAMAEDYIEQHFEGRWGFFSDYSSREDNDPDDDLFGWGAIKTLARKADTVEEDSAEFIDWVKAGCPELVRS
jgi:hypothetical protein